MRDLNEIAADIEKIEKAIKEATDLTMRAVAQLGGMPMDAGSPGIKHSPLIVTLPDGRSLQLSSLAEEIREHAEIAGDFRQR